MFVLVGLLLGEIVARIFVLTSDIPMRTLTDDQIQKYIPNQQGSWKGGTHKWQINELGWPGPLPDSYDNLITVIGDSFIENFMNPDSCHQAVLLKKELPEYNFLEISRSGVSFIEALEMTKELDSLNPKYHLIYVSDSDFDESISQIKHMADITQLDLDTKQIVHGTLNSPGMKKILYNWKFLFYLYRRFPIRVNHTPISSKDSISSTKKITVKLDRYNELFAFVKSKYETDNVIFVFRPETSMDFVELTKKYNIKYLLLNDSNDESWSFEYDHHWTCYGHEKVSKQVSKFIEKM